MIDELATQQLAQGVVDGALYTVHPPEEGCLPVSPAALC